MPEKPKRGKGTSKETTSAKEKKLGNKLGIYGKVLDTHLEAKDIWAKVKKTHGPAKANPSKMWAALKERPSKPPLDFNNEIGHRMERSAHEFSEIYEAIQKQATESSLRWTSSTCEANLEYMEKQARKLADILAIFNQDAEGIQNFCSQQRKELASARLTDIRKQITIAKPYTAGGTPGNVVKWLIRKKALGLVTQVTQGTEAEEDIPDAEENQEKVQDNLAFNEGITVNPVAIDLENPCIWTPDTTCELGKTLQLLPPSLGRRLGQPALDILNGKLKREAEHVKPDTPCGGALCHARLEARGEPVDTLEQLKWAPSDWKSDGISPEALRDHGAPWILSGNPGSARFMNNGWPIPGHGQFLSGIQGGSVVVTLPYWVILEKGVDMDIAATWLCNEVKASVFDDILDNHGRAATLAQNAVMWVPFGWLAILVTHATSPQGSHVLMTPMTSVKLANQCPDILRLVKFWESILARRTTETWKKLKDTFAKYFVNILALNAQKGTPATSLPLENGNPPPLMDTPILANPAAAAESKDHPRVEDLASQPLGDLEKSLEGILDKTEETKETEIEKEDTPEAEEAEGTPAKKKQRTADSQADDPEGTLPMTSDNP